MFPPRGPVAVLFDRVVHVPSSFLNRLHQPAPLLQLIAHKVHSPLQDDAFGAALSLESRDEFRQAVEAFADGLTALLFCMCRFWHMSWVSTHRIAMAGRRERRHTAGKTKEESAWRSKCKEEAGREGRTGSDVVLLLLLLRQARLLVDPVARGGGGDTAAARAFGCGRWQ